MDMMRYEISIATEDGSIRGQFEIDGRTMIVSSPYGTTRINLGLLKPDAAARKILKAQHTRQTMRPVHATPNQEGIRYGLVNSV